MDDDTVEALVAIHGEPYRRMIVDALRWLDAQETGMQEAGMGLRVPVGRNTFIRDLIRGVKKGLA